MQPTILKNTFDNNFIYPNSRQLKKIFTYISLVLFTGLVFFVSSSVNRFIVNSISITLDLAEPSDFQENTFSKNIFVKKGDTFQAILFEENIIKEDRDKIIKLVQEKKLISDLKIGQKITFEYETIITEDELEDLATDSRTLSKIIIELSKLKSIEITRKDNDFIIHDIVVTLNKELYKSSTTINSSFMSALKSLGLSNNSIVELINAYAYQIDFQRQIKSGDQVSVITEKFLTPDGKFSHHGKILYVSLIANKKEYNLYRYSLDNLHNNQLFFSEDGKSAKRSLLRTPLKLIKVSSHYGNRTHPTLGYTKMHKGVDFAAPKGTPIYAAGNGVVTEIGWKSGYGNFVQVKHSSTLSTAYAHASSFAKNLKLGSIVKQGQIIALVGATGRATGPHLHYEVKINGQNVNPLSVKTTPGIELKGQQLAKFNQFKKDIRALNVKL